MVPIELIQPINFFDKAYSSNMAYQVSLASGDASFAADSAATLLDAAIKSGYVLPYSCNRGNCSTCECTLVQGSVVQQGQHREAGSTILTCQAQATADCVIDVDYVPELQRIERVLVPAKVAKITYHNDVAIVHLRLPPTAKLIFLEGQYVNLIADGIKRSYSIASSGYDSGLQLHIKKIDGGAMSGRVFNHFKIDTLVRIEGPLGAFFVRHNARPIAFLATGTGFAPVQAMVSRLLADGTGRPMKIYWGNRVKADFYSDLPDTWAKNPNVQFIPVTSRERGAMAQGYVQEVFAGQVNDLPEYDVYACGSPAMVQSAKQLLTQRGLPARNFYADAFVATTE